MNGTVTIAQAGPYTYTFPMTATLIGVTLIGYARCSTDRQDLAAQRQALLELGVAEDRIYTDHGITGTTRARPGLDQALATMRQGDTLVVPKLDRLARSVPDARAIADQLQERGVKLALSPTLYDPSDPVGKMFFNILATFAEFEADLIRLRTREGMAIARAKGKLRGKQPKLSDRQQRELCRMHDTGEYSISDLADLFSVSRPTVYRTLNRRLSPGVRFCPLPESTHAWASTSRPTEPPRSTAMPPKTSSAARRRKPQGRRQASGSRRPSRRKTIDPDGIYRERDLVTIELDSFGGQLYSRTKLREIETERPDFLGRNRQDVITRHYIVDSERLGSGGAWECTVYDVDSGTTMEIPNDVYLMIRTHYTRILETQRRDNAANAAAACGPQNGARQPHSADDAAEDPGPSASLESHEQLSDHQLDHEFDQQLN